MHASIIKAAFVPIIDFEAEVNMVLMNPMMPMTWTLQETLRRESSPKPQLTLGFKAFKYSTNDNLLFPPVRNWSEGLCRVMYSVIKYRTD